MRIPITRKHSPGCRAGVFTLVVLVTDLNLGHDALHIAAELRPVQGLQMLCTQGTMTDAGALISQGHSCA